MCFHSEFCSTETDNDDSGTLNSVFSRENHNGSLAVEGLAYDSVQTLGVSSAIIPKTTDSVEALVGSLGSSREETLAGVSVVQSQPNLNGCSPISRIPADSLERLDSSLGLSPNGSSGLSPNGSSLKSSMDSKDEKSSCPTEANLKGSSQVLLLEPPPLFDLEFSKEETKPHSLMQTESNNGGNDDDGDGVICLDRNVYRTTHDSFDLWGQRPHYGYPSQRPSPWYKQYQRYHRWDSQWPGWPVQGPPPTPSEPEEVKVEIEATGVGAGLNNMGNTCFINAILQCFVHTVPLVQGLRSHNHMLPCDRAGEGFCVICALCDQIELSFTNSGWMISPSKIVHNLKYFSSFFQEHQQEDAHEFLQCFLDKLERCCLDSKTQDESSSPQDVNLVQHVFGGCLVSKLQCCNCGHCSDTFEPLIDLSLEIDDVDTLPCALESFTKLEKIDDPDTRFTCDNCKEKVSVVKQLLLDQSPSIAAFHLKRFKTDAFSVMKISKHVEFPLELDLQPYTSGSQNNNVELKYWLYAVVVHIGTTSTSGHYFCYIRSSPGIWHKLDDETVERVEEEYVLSQCAYILFYTKHGTPWFSSSFEVKKPHLNTDLSNSSPKSVLDNLENDSTYGSAVNTESSTANETTKVSSGIFAQLSFETRDVGGQGNEVGNAAEGISVNFNESRHDTPMTDTIMPVGASSHSDETLYNEKSSTIFSPGSNSNQDISGAEGNDSFHSLTPPRSPSPNADLRCRKEGSHQIPRNHLKTQNQVAFRKPQRRIAKDSRKMEALRYLSKNMPVSRGMKFMNAMMCRDGGSPSKKRKLKSSPCKKGSPDARRKLNHASVMSLST